MTRGKTGDLKNAMAGEVIFRNPLKKYLEPPINSNDSACTNHHEPKIYEVPLNFGRNASYAIDAHRNLPGETNSEDTVGILLKSLPILSFGKKMANLLEDTTSDHLDKLNCSSFDDSSRHYFAVERAKYVQMFRSLPLQVPGSVKPVTAELKYPHNAFGSVDASVSAMTGNLFTPGWKDVSLYTSYGPERFYIKDATTARRSFKDVFAEWRMSHEIEELAVFNNSSGFFIYYDAVAQEFKGVHSLDYNEKPTVIDLDSGELYNIESFDDEIRLLPEELRGRFEPVVAARLMGDISEERYAHSLSSIEKTKKIHVTGCENGALLVSPADPIVVSKKDICHAFCNAPNCLGKCGLKDFRRSVIHQ